MRSSLWAAIDPASSWKVEETGGYTNTDNDASAATTSAKSNPLSTKQPHFGFMVLLVAVGGTLYWIYEGKGSGAKVAANIGPVGGELEAGLGKDGGK